MSSKSVRWQYVIQYVTIAPIIPPSATPEMHEPALSVTPSGDAPSSMAKSPPAFSSKEKTPQKKSNDDIWKEPNEQIKKKSADKVAFWTLLAYQLYPFKSSQKRTSCISSCRLGFSRTVSLIPRTWSPEMDLVAKNRVQNSAWTAYLLFHGFFVLCLSCLLYWIKQN